MSLRLISSSFLYKIPEATLKYSQAGKEPESLARIYAMVGEYDEAIQLLEDLIQNCLRRDGLVQ